MGGWTRLAGALSNSSIVNNQVGPNGEYPRILRVVGDGTIVAGWYTSWRYWFKVDISKAYVTYCWVRKRSATSANLYLGWTNSANFVDTLAGVNEPNPYFVQAQNPTIADKWYLCVGVIWPSGYGSGDTGLAGVYDPHTGVRVFDGNEFRHNTAATQQYLRIGFYNNTTAQASTDGYDFLPVGTYCMDGTQPTKEAIMNTVPAAMTAALSKETFVFSANNDGSVPVASYTGSGTQIRVYQGTAELTYDATGTTKGTWTITSTTPTNITVGTIADSGIFATVGDHSGVATGTDTSTIVYNISGTTLTGASFTLVKTQTFAKAKGGAPGTNGVRTAVLEMYQWASSAPTTFPTGTASTYTWATGTFTAPGTPNGWTITPGASSPGQILYVVTQIYTDTLTTATSSVTWSATTSAAAGAAGTNGNPGANATRTAILEMYQWASSAPSTFPTGTASTYTWATGVFTAPGTPNGWALTPGTPTAGQILYVVRQIYTDTSTTATSSVTWSATGSLPSGAAGTNGNNGNPGANGQRVGVLELYRWSAAPPTTYPAGDSVYTWATGAFTAPGTPNSWSLNPPAAVVGQTLWGISIRVSNNTTDATSTVTWTSTTPYAVGYAGTDGINGNPGERGSKQFYATGSSWSDATANAAITTAGLTTVLLDQVTISNGTNFAETRFWNGSAWTTISQVINGNLLVNGTVGATKLAVSSLDAVSANIGTLRTASSGARTEISDNIIKVFDTTGNIRVKIGNLAL
jgi:hypothetical protein